ncbi:MAG TPA: sigma 54-interacting transcriptional regulator [Methylomirabilota bacterium]|jgi:transcriptional regulator with AAA-type ATPase domain/tetratricopeptide (TPR) repeat protein|nr:sigma 54-interacting transcriptional regulator [Methylomirabilota bacterium]
MQGVEDLLGESAAIQGVRENIRRLLARPQTGRRLPSILIQGETGTGKGLVARLIHRHGPRAEGPFVDVNCAAIPETLLEAELFGFERGAFTDARRAKPGLFQTAHRGTIFLDEIGLLPEALQAKLLKVLEEQAVRRLGSTSSEPVDVWIISATNTDLQSAIAARRFREDLYHRLAVLTLQLPPLRERDRDVVLLAERFLARACADYGLPRKTLSPEAQARLLAYHWPGNIRELGNMIERVALLAEDVVVSAEVLELPSGTGPHPAAPIAAAPPASLEDAMRDHLLAALTQTGWNISRTAALLGISRNTLRARIEKFGLRTGASPAAPARRPTRLRAPTSGVAEPSPPAYASPASAPAVAAPSAIRWESRRVTLLRATLITPDADEELPDTSRALDVLLDKLRVFGGRIEELSPRGVGAVFGLEPVEDAPRRAAHAAMAIQKAAERGRRGDGEPFSVKIGIHVGQVLVGQASAGIEIDASAKHAQWTVLDALLTSASPDSTLLSVAAATFLERRFELAIESKMPERAYLLQGRERKGLALEGEMAWFVGRRQELDLLKSRLASARAGHGQIVGMVGEAGIGKSRLLYEFRQALRGEAITYIEGHCLSYGSTIPYLPALEILRHACRITDVDAPETVTHKLRVNLKHLGIDPTDALPYLLQFLGIKAGTEALATGTPEAIRARTFQILRQMCIAASRQRPLIIAVEDMHWIDAASEALGGMVESLEGVPLLLVLTYRPGYRPPWLEKSHVTQIALQPLSAEDSLSVLGGLLPPTRLSDPVTQLIVSKADGNPFFLEELARTVREQGELSPELTVPDTVEEVLLARINRLPERERRLLQSAAVVGKRVSVDVLRAIANLLDPALSEALAQLRAADFLYEDSSGPEVQYSFKHALTQEVGYASLRPELRRELHARIVEAIETIHPERLIEHVERLAHHSLRGELRDKAVTYLRRAGAKAAARPAHRQAVAYFEQALEALQQLPESTETIEQAIDLRLALRNSLHPLGDLAPILDHLQKAEGLSKALPDQRRRGLVFSFMSQYFRLSGVLDRAIESGESALDIAKLLEDTSLQIAVSTHLGPAYAALGDYRRAIEILAHAVASLQENPILEDSRTAGLLSVFSRIYLVYCLAERGEFREGIAYGEEAIRLAQAADHPYSLTFAYGGVGTLFLLKGELDSAIPVLERGRDLCEVLNFPLLLPVLESTLGAAYALSARHAEAIRLLEHAVRQAVSMKRMGEHSMLVTRLGEAYLLAGRVDDAVESAQRALQLSREHRERGREAYSLRLLGEIASGRDSLDVEKAEASYREAATLGEELEMRPLLAHCNLGLARLYHRAERRPAAEACLARAIAMFRALDMPFWLKRAEAELNPLG